MVGVSKVGMDAVAKWIIVDACGVVVKTSAEQCFGSFRLEE